MPSGAGVGYPDWQRYSNWVGQPLVAPQQIDVLPATQTFGPFVVSQWQSVLFTINNGAHPLKITIDSTPFGELVAVQQSFVMQENSQTQFVIANRSDRIKVLLSSALASVPSPDTIDWSLRPCNLPEGVHPTSFQGGMLAQATLTIAAGTRQNVALPFYFGQAMVYVGQGGQPLIPGVSITDENTTELVNPSLSFAAGVGWFQQLYLPGMRNRISVFNNGAANATVPVLVVAVQP